MYWQLSFCTHASVRNVLAVVPLSGGGGWSRGSPVRLLQFDCVADTFLAVPDWEPLAKGDLRRAY